MRSTCWRATAPRRSAICVTSPTPSSTSSRRRSPRRRSPRRSACSATRRAPSASIAPRSRHIAPQPKLEFGRTDYGSSLRDAAAFVTLASEGGAPRATIDGAVERIEAARGALALHLDAGERLDGAGGARARARTPARMALDVDGETRAGRALPQLPRGRADGAACTSPTTATTTVQAVVSVIGAPLTPEPAADKGFKIERNYYTLDGEPADPSKGEAERALRRGAEDHRAAAAIRPHHRRRLSAGRLRDRQSAAGLVGRYRHAVVDRGRAGAGAHASSATTASPRRSSASSDTAVFTVAYVVRAVSPGNYVLPQAYVEDMYRPDRFGRTATGTIDDHGGEMKTLAPASAAGCRRSAARRRRRSPRAAYVAVARPGAARARGSTISTWWSTATASCCAPMPPGRALAAAGDGRRRRSALPRAC